MFGAPGISVFQFSSANGVIQPAAAGRLTLPAHYRLHRQSQSEILTKS